jgi:hypothetical protein
MSLPELDSRLSLLLDPEEKLATQNFALAMLIRPYVKIYWRIVRGERSSGRWKFSAKSPGEFLSLFISPDELAPLVEEVKLFGVSNGHENGNGDGGA